MASDLLPPDPFARTTRKLHGDAGVAWLGRLPAIVADREEAWGISVGTPFSLSYNYVATALRHDGTPVVLKVGFPGNPEFGAETEALRILGGRGAVRLLDVDAERGALLLERAEPGTPLTRLALEDDVAATTVAASVMRRILTTTWRLGAGEPGRPPEPAGHPFPTVAGWGRGFARHRRAFDGTSGPLATEVFERGERLFAELVESAGPPVLLHGDLHHDNILAAGREPWLAIDPKGVLGEPAYETAALIRNPYPRLLDQPDPARLLARRLDQLADELADHPGMDRRRIGDWAFAQTVLSAVWTVEDRGHGWDYDLAVADLLRTG